jgi:thymidylate synthase (FAD)
MLRNNKKMTHVSEVANDPDYIECLDLGFVGLIDHMGSDSAIVKAAQVSYGKGTKKSKDERSLLRYMMRHQHSSPFEQCEIKLHIKCPIFVIRQMVRHRTHCLSGDTLLYFDLPARLAKGGRGCRKVSVKKTYDMWAGNIKQKNSGKRRDTYTERVDPKQIYTIRELSDLVDYGPDALRVLINTGFLKARKNQANNPSMPSISVKGSDYIAWANAIYTRTINPMQDRLKNQFLRMVNETTGEIESTHITDIWQSGVKPVYRLELANGYSIKTSKDHRFLTRDGWFALKDAVDLRLNPDHSVKGIGKSADFSVNGVPLYQSEKFLNKYVAMALTNKEIGDLAGCSAATVKKYTAAFAIKYSKEAIGSIASRLQIGKPKLYARGPRKMTPEHLANVRRARSGAASNFWKGGVSANNPRKDDLRLKSAGKACFIRDGYKCRVCKSNKMLNAHHITPVWRDPSKVYEVDNLLTMCKPCHVTTHSKHLEFKLRREIKDGTDLKGFFTRWKARSAISKSKRKMLTKRKSTKLGMGYSAIKNITFAGFESTYDIEVSGPYHNFVADGFIVHNSMNEYSGRFSEMHDEFYIPELEDIQPQSTTNKQGRAGTLTDLQKMTYQQIIKDHSDTSYARYQDLLGEETEDDPGIARELARMVLPLNIYTEFYWKQNLKNLLHLLKLRLDSHAQMEIRVFAQAIYDIIKPLFPLTIEAWQDYELNAYILSAQEINIVQSYLRLDKLSNLRAACKAQNMSEREITTFMAKFSQSGLSD